MEVVLLEDVKALGKKGQIVKVNDGYARNFILPKKLGVEATPKNLNDLKLQKANAAKVAAEQLAAAKELAEKLADLSVTVSIKAGEADVPSVRLRQGDRPGGQGAAEYGDRQEEAGASGALKDLRHPPGIHQAPQGCDGNPGGEGRGGINSDSDTGEMRRSFHG